MKRSIYISLLFILSHVCHAQTYFQQQVDYDMDVELMVNDKKYEATATIKYYNNSPETISEIYFHLWANAYSNNSTEFAFQKLRMNQTDFYFRDVEDNGGYEEISFSQNNTELSFESYKGHTDVVKLVLDSPVAAGEMIEIQCNFTVKIPPFFSRMGRQNGYFQITQWFPKPAVFDHNGWHPMPYLDIGEFYSEFGNYKVNVTVPNGFVVAATGEHLPIEGQKPGHATFSFNAENVHDFAWCAYNNFSIEKDQTTLSNGEKVDLYVYKVNKDESWDDALFFLKRSVEYYSKHVGNYPYPQATVVQSPGGTGSGMEYPMLTTIDLAGNPQEVDHVITHEVGHNWFYGILASNEREVAWMDEGMNSFFDHKYNDTYYKTGSYDGRLPNFIDSDTSQTLLEKSLVFQCKRGRTQSCSIHCNDYNMLNYGLSAYEYPALSFKYLQAYLGEETFLACIKEYYNQWKFKHPGPEDVKAIFENVSGRNLSWFFDQILDTTHHLDYAITKVEDQPGSSKITIKRKGPLEIPVRLDFRSHGEWVDHIWVETVDGQTVVEGTKKEFDHVEINGLVPYIDVNRSDNFKSNTNKRKIKPTLKFLPSIDNPKKAEIFLSPLIMGNAHDGTILGLTFANSIFPQKWTRLHASFGYGFRSKEIVGVANLERDWLLSSPKFRKITLGANYRQFTGNSFSIEAGDFELPYKRIQPKVTLYFTPVYRESRDSWLSYSFIHLWNNTLAISDANPDEFIVAADNQSFHQLDYHFHRRKALRKFDFDASALYHDYVDPFQNEKSFLQLTATSQWKIQYVNRSFFRVRLFGGFFPINDSRNANSFNNAIARGSLNASYNSFADVTHGEYFLGRNKQDHWGEKQILYRQGGFKTPLIYNTSHIGKSNNALFAANFKLDIPVPLFRALPIKPYADLAYYSYPENVDMQYWNFIYDAGFALEFFDGALGIYLPILQSSDITQVYESQDFWRKISFQIDINKARVWDLIDRTDL